MKNFINKIHKNHVITLGVALAITIYMFCTKPFAQDPTYHDLADKRAFLGLGNFFDVMSNLPFIILGLIGLHQINQESKRRALFSMKGEKTLWQIFCLGIFLVGFGSSYYHLSPNTPSMIWDRLPITISFMSLFSLAIMERIDAKLGLILSPLLFTAGIGTVLYWHYTESLGMGDLRAYALIQLIPLMLIPVMLWLFPARYTHGRYLVYSIVWYVLAKVLESYDAPIFNLLGGILSGHTLKHLAVAIGIYTMLLYLKDRRLIS
jgi:hypothetical protein